MARQSTVIDVFLSSPSDVGPERELILLAAQEWNLLRAAGTGCHLNILTWENIVAPALSARPQDVINNQVGSDYDVYLGMMWSRLGSPTGSADSGTVEEFNLALERFRGGDALRLAFLFKTAPIPPAILDGAQYAKVADFKRRFSDEGGMYREFDSDHGLRVIANRLFEQIAGQKDVIVERDADLSAFRFQSQPLDTQGKLPVADDLSDMGLLDLNDRLIAVVTEQTNFLDGWMSVLNSNTDEAQRASNEMGDLTKFGQADPAALKPIMSRISHSMNTLSSYVEDNIGGFIDRNDAIVSLTEVALDISQDFSDDQENTFRSSISELQVQIAENKVSLEDLVQTTRSLPRLTTEFNRAKKRAVVAQETMLAEMERLSRDLGNSVYRFDSQITNESDAT